MVDEEIILSVCRRCKLCAKWGKNLVSEYLLDTRRTCAKEPASLGDRDLMTYAVGLVDSESRKEYMSGARLLATFIKQGKDVRSLLLLSRPKLQKLIDTLGWRGIPGYNQEIRVLVAKIVADVAGNIHLVQYPGAAQCISSMFEEDEEELPPRENRNHEEGDQEGEMSSISTEGDTYNENELILQGLTILETLASNHYNCRDICNTPSLLSVITAPIYSDTLIQDIKVSACAEVAYRSLKVVHQLIIRTPGETLRREIRSSNQAMRNLEKILDPGTEANQELQLGAMEILTEMALHPSTNLADEAKENLITTRLLHIFLTENPTAMLKIMAGRTLELLSSKRERNSLYIIRERDDNADRLTEIMFDDGNSNINYKITAAKILVNLCTHSMLPEEFLKGTLLPKVLARILPSNAETQQRSSQRSICNCFPKICGDDEENQLPNQSIHNQQPTQEKEEQILAKRLLEASLSLTSLIYDKMISVDGFAAVFQEKAPAGQLVAALKTIVEENCMGKATSVSLRIVKLCSQIAISMIQRQRSQYIAHFRDQKFMEPLSKAVGKMSKLESCMLVTGTNNCRMRKNARPLLSELEKKLCDLVS